MEDEVATYIVKIQELEKANRVLQKKLDRIETEQRRLEATNQKKEFLLRKVIQEAKESRIELEKRSQELEQTLQELQQAQLQLIQSEKMSSLGQLVAGVAHEINNPVSFISGNLKYAEEYIETLLQLLHLYRAHYPEAETTLQANVDRAELEFIEADLPRLLASMKMGAGRITEIVLSLRTFSRMDETGCKLVNIYTGIESTLLILGNRLKAQHYRPDIVVAKDYSDLPPIECYAGQLNQVFMNILVNAIDALDERDEARSIEDNTQDPSLIQIKTAQLNSDWIAIHIRDNGPGIPSNLHKRLFDPFFTTKPIGRGTGMGLSISYQIVTEKHNGMLEVVSNPGQGTEFVITLPIRQPYPTCSLK